jgi:streptomycin 6-kinase
LKQHATKVVLGGEKIAAASNKPLLIETEHALKESTVLLVEKGIENRIAKRLLVRVEKCLRAPLPSPNTELGTIRLEGRAHSKRGIVEPVPVGSVVFEAE